MFFCFLGLLKWPTTLGAWRGRKHTCCMWQSFGVSCWKGLLQMIALQSDWITLSTKLTTQRYHALVRAWEPERCSIFSLLLYFLVRFQVLREPFPDLSCEEWPPAWWSIKLFPGTDSTKSICYATHYHRTKADHMRSGLVSRKKTHRARKAGVDNAAAYG